MKYTELNPLFVLRKGEERKIKSYEVRFFFFSLFFSVVSVNMPQFHLKQGMHKAFQSEFCSCVFFIFVKFADWQQENHLISISGPSSRLDLNILTVSWLVYD